MLPLIKQVLFESRICFIFLLITVLATGSPVSKNTDKKETLTPDPEDVEQCQRDPSKCAGIENYPRKFVENLVLENPILFEELNPNNEKADTPGMRQSNVRGRRSVAQSTYSDDKLEGEQFCKVNISFGAPQIGVNKNNESFFLIQYEKGNYIQGIRTETCLSKKGSESASLSQVCASDNLFNGEPTECEQKFSYPTFVVIDVNTSKPIFEPIRIPSSCVCTYGHRNSN